MNWNSIKNGGLRHWLLLMAVLQWHIAAAQNPPPNWTVNSANFQFNMSVVARLKSNQIFDNDGGNLIGVFVGNELRGVGQPVVLAGEAYYFLNVYANAYAGETLRFKVYYPTTGAIADAAEQLGFKHNMFVGKTFAPFVLSACKPSVIAEDCNTSGVAGMDDDCDDQIDEDISPPTARCKAVFLTLPPSGMGTLAVAAVNDGSSDACTAVGSLLLSLSPNIFDCDDVGVRTATLTVSDAAGNSATCTATITVLDALYFSQEAQRMASDGLAKDNFGWCLDLNGSTAIAGAPEDKVGTQSKQGSAYVFLQNQGGTDNWGQLKQIKASDGAAVDYFGNAISMDGTNVLVGAHGDNVGATTDAGSAYIFEKDLGGANNWGQQTNITARNGAVAESVAYDYFANAVSLKNGQAVIGAAKKKIGANTAQGAAYIYQKDAGGANAWGNVKKLTASDGAANNFFGQSVAQSGDLVLVGANGNQNNRGAAYFFNGSDSWNQLQKLTASDAATGDGFGTSISLTANYAVVGAPNKATYTGAAYVFKRNGSTWAQLKILTASDAAANDRFGTIVAVSGEYAYVSAIRANMSTGAVYVFHRDAGGADNWGQIGRYTAVGGAAGDQFGYSLAVNAGRMALGANLDDVAAKADQGSIYIFKGEDCAGGPKPNEETVSQSATPAIEPAVKCSPNPFQDELTVEIGNLGNENCEIRVTDAAGREIARADLPVGTRRFALKTDDFRAGMYFVQVASEVRAQIVPVVLIR